MRVDQITALAFQLNAAVDRGLPDMTVDEVKSRIRDGTLFESFPPEVTGPSALGEAEQKELLKEWTHFADDYGDPEYFRVRSGFALLIAYCLESIQKITP